MKQLRRLDIASPADVYERLQRGALRYADVPEAELRRLERERPELIVTDGEAALACVPRPSLLYELGYAFPDRDAFVRTFPELFRRVLQAADPDEGPLGFRLTLTEAPSRPYVEPVLFAHAFEVAREWIRMELAALPAHDAPADEIAPGFVLRGVMREDANALAELEAAAFAVPMMIAAIARERVIRAPAFRVLEDRETKTVVGFLRLRLDSPGTGYVSDVAVHPDEQRRGLGEAMMRWALAWFRGQGLRRAALTVNAGNGAAIALYRKLGFAAGLRGLDYRRPIDEDEVRQVLEKHRAPHITVRRRWS